MADQRNKRGTRVDAAPRPVRTGRAGETPKPRPAAAMRSIARVAAEVAEPARAVVAAPVKPVRTQAKPALKRSAAPARSAAKQSTPARKSVARGRRLAGAAPAGKAAKQTAALGRGAKRKPAGRTGHLAVPVRTVKIKELNAQGKCGPGTSVVHLFRVDEVRDGTPAVHLVFFDRHGWYCEHGRSCHAVDDVRKLAGSQATRTYSVG